MPLPQALARFNRHVTNRIARPVAGRVPPLAVVVHRGRRSGRLRRTPVLAIPGDGAWTIPLTYGPQVDWLRNVLAAGGCTLERSGRRIELTGPRVLAGEEALSQVPAPVRAGLRVLRSPHVLHLTETG